MLTGIALTALALVIMAFAMAVLPPGMDEKDMVRDETRHGHWVHKPTGTVVSLPRDWEPGKGTGEGSILASEEISKLKQPELRELAKKLGITNYIRMSNPELVKAILEQLAANQRKKIMGENLTGTRVEVLIGRLQGQRGTITEEDEENGSVRVLLNDGNEVPFDSPHSQLRKLTAEEIAAEEALLAEKQN